MAALATRTTGRHYGETLPRVPASALAARRLVCNTLTSWGVGELAEQAAVIVSELVANTVQHARRESIRVTVEHTAPGTVRIATADFSRRLPVPRLPGEDDEGGRGLALVEAMAQRWGVEERRWGKIVWAEVTR
ncbi:ATP-binding protein [Streptomyces physcomitrii]|uniref:ATP-binding protein n=1 Tax=Streptomyces physcomitrii TaxID=2724184 RepID=UPI0005913A1B